MRNEITMNWDDNRCRVLRYSVKGQWNWGELESRLLVGGLMMSALPHRVDVVLDLTEMTYDSPRAFARELSRVPYHLPGSGTVVAVTEDLEVNSLLSVLEPRFSQAGWSLVTADSARQSLIYA